MKTIISCLLLILCITINAQKKESKYEPTWDETINWIHKELTSGFLEGERNSFDGQYKSTFRQEYTDITHTNIMHFFTMKDNFNYGKKVVTIEYFYQCDLTRLIGTESDNKSLILFFTKDGVKREKKAFSHKDYRIFDNTIDRKSMLILFFSNSKNVGRVKSAFDHLAKLNNSKRK